MGMQPREPRALDEGPYTLSRASGSRSATPNLEVAVAVLIDTEGERVMDLLTSLGRRVRDDHGWRQSGGEREAQFAGAGALAAHAAAGEQPQGRNEVGGLGGAGVQHRDVAECFAQVAHGCPDTVAVDETGH